MNIFHSVYRSLILPILPTRPDFETSFPPGGNATPATTGEWSRRFLQHQGLRTGKWWSYLPVYDEIVVYLSQLPRERVLVEIGVAGGGSLEIWRNCLPAKSTKILGIDIDPDCARLPLDGCEILIGSQSDSDLLRRIVKEVGAIDVVIDDGSHKFSDQFATLQHLWPHVSDGGYYIIEDVHTSYWWLHGGLWGRRKTAIGLCKRLLDVMHKPYHRFYVATELRMFQDSLVSLSIRDSMMVLRKTDRVKRVADIRPRAQGAA